MNSLSDASNTVDKSWRRLPNPIPPVEMDEALRPMQKENLQYLEKRFQEALTNGIITLAGEGGVAPYQPGNPEGTYEQETFEIHDFTLDGVAGTVNNMMLEDIQEAIDRVLSHAEKDPEWHIAPDNREGIRVSFDIDGEKDGGWFLLRMSVHDPVLPLNCESDIEGGVRKILEKLFGVLKDLEGVDLSNLEKAC